MENFKMAKPTTTKLITNTVRLSFVHLLEPAETLAGDMKYSTQILIPKSDTATLGKIENAIEAAKEIAKAKNWNGKIPANLNMPLRDGDEEFDDDDNEIVYNINEQSKHWNLFDDLDKAGVKYD